MSKNQSKYERKKNDQNNEKKKTHTRIPHTETLSSPSNQFIYIFIFTFLISFKLTKNYKTYRKKCEAFRPFLDFYFW